MKLFIKTVYGHKETNLKECVKHKNKTFTYYFKKARKDQEGFVYNSDGEILKSGQQRSISPLKVKRLFLWKY